MSTLGVDTITVPPHTRCGVRANAILAAFADVLRVHRACFQLARMRSDGTVVMLAQLDDGNLYLVPQLYPLEFTDNQWLVLQTLCNERLRAHGQHLHPWPVDNREVVGYCNSFGVPFFTTPGDYEAKLEMADRAWLQQHAIVAKLPHKPFRAAWGVTASMGVYRIVPSFVRSHAVLSRCIDAFDSQTHALLSVQNEVVLTVPLFQIK